MKGNPRQDSYVINHKRINPYLVFLIPCGDLNQTQPQPKTAHLILGVQNELTHTLRSLSAIQYPRIFISWGQLQFKFLEFVLYAFKVSGSIFALSLNIITPAKLPLLMREP